MVLCLQRADLKPGEKMYYAEEGALLQVEIMENRCREDRLEYRIKTLALLRPSMLIPSVTPGEEDTISGCYVRFYDEEDLENQFGLRMLNEEQAKERLRCLSALVRQKREDYLKQADPALLFAYQTQSGRKVVELEGRTYTNGNAPLAFDNSNSNEPRDAVIVGSLSPSQYQYESTLDPGMVELVVPTVEKGKRLVCFQLDAAEGEVPCCYYSTPVQKIVAEERTAVEGLSVEDVCARLYQKLEEVTGEEKC